MENKPQREKGWKKSSVGTATERRPRGTAEPKVEGLEAVKA